MLRLFTCLAVIGLLSGCHSERSSERGSSTRRGNSEPGLVSHALPGECAGSDCCPAGFQVIEGSGGADVIAGGNQSQCILALDGSDQVSGDNGADYLDCGEGDDACFGGNGEDTVSGGEGDDVLSGGEGKDLLRGGPGRDNVSGGNGKDIFVVASVCEAVPGERLDGGNGMDTLRTPLSLEQLAELGIELLSIENIEPLSEADGGPECVIPEPGNVGDPAADPLGHLCGLLAQTAAVVRGRVVAINPAFDERPGEGPRQVVELGDVTTLVGLALPNTLKLRVFGGELPDGDLIQASHTPRFQVGDDYVVFLWNRAWRFAPVPLDYYLRVRTEAARELLITESGHVLTGPLGGQLIRQSFSAVEVDAAQNIKNPLSDLELSQAASTDAYATELAAIAQACPQGPNGVFTPFPVVPWDVLPAAREAPVVQ